ncbi:MAG: hypothetical protein COZ34_01310 [Candidatus Pacebacteria bacterium CG_4_10_14_3_um_filter_34_15]|nr:hypothetical protein [Candidatus Pacearchaeota archaeon]NCQ65302.1 hypothetical protein [Candidatus Paceibacterota bacterium]OIO44977.1 MAG: hypothetical protein AUJ41_00900 [Candidatus Pacebacteria bacterium CG1_02_43_31]PIQ81080.1 MAG: hypothetical protein COV78_02665 [Candidatus Pacebacteria bacterium CG11_big_fil_rev_8_21_14_0_20_34_55]PIX81897.1 MAG: hypothetical protein COZ34_01310 [Candidatus Pacebacteria bacterium CG_4_10_14_3_um_filter_34_15]PJC44112.1 MAG: hypothetical protein CO0
MQEAGKDNFNQQLIALQRRRTKISAAQTKEWTNARFQEIEQLDAEIESLQEKITNSGSAGLGVGNFSKESARGNRFNK